MFFVGDMIENIHNGECCKIVKTEFVCGKTVYVTDKKNGLNRFNSDYENNFILVKERNAKEK